MISSGKANLEENQLRIEDALPTEAQAAARGGGLAVVQDQIVWPVPG